jgi:DNA repair protein RadA/Sms
VVGAEPVPLSSVDPAGCRPSTTGLAEVDRVLAGGLTPGSVTLVYGEPGVGKSTLLLQVALGMAHTGQPVLLVSAEESASQVRARADRLGALPDRLHVLAAAELEAAERAADLLRPRLMVVDSIQTMTDRQAPGAPGTVGQVRGCADRLATLARRLGVALVVVGHVTKDGDMAGPRTLEHLVDTVLSFEGDRHHTLRVLRAVKHRFGPTGEVGLFEMGDAGLTTVAEPGRLLLGDRRPEVAGSAVTALLEGRRPLLVEVQALACTASPGAVPRRNTQGLDGRRLAVLLGVLECRAGTSLAGLEVFTSAAGGIRAVEPATDLPVLLAVASAVSGRPLPADLVSFGEVGLAGEIRQVVGHDRRLAEAARLGFGRALVPASTGVGPDGMVLVRVGSVAEALAAARSGADDPTGPHRRSAGPPGRAAAATAAAASASPVSTAVVP